MLKNFKPTNQDGYFLIDLLLSMTIWVLLVSSLLPIFIQVQKQTQDVRQELHGYHVLYEAAQAFLLLGRQEFGTERRENYVYDLYWKDNGSDVKVCVAYENHFKELVEKCETVY